eukprot:scaffold101045_cov69-Phaeocystis_antarctica.AAC.2
MVRGVLRQPFGWELRRAHISGVPLAGFAIAAAFATNERVVNETPDKLRELCTSAVRAFRVKVVVAWLHLVGQCSVRGPRVGAAHRDDPASGEQRKSVCHIRNSVVAARVWHERVSAKGALRDGRVVRAAITLRLRLGPSNEPHDECSHAGHQ